MTTFRKGRAYAVLLTKTLRVMQLSAVLLLGFCLQVAASGHAQKVTFSGQNVPLEELFTSVKIQTGYKAIYDQHVISARTVSINVRDIALEDLLQMVLRPLSMEYMIRDKTIFVKTISTESLSPGLFPDDFSRQNPPPITIRGRIVNEKGEPVIASITIKGTNRGTTTNDAGVFELNNVAEDAILVISCVGYAPREVKADASLVIGLEPSISKLDEVQIIAYGTTTKRLNTGTVSTVKAADIEKQPVSNPLASLQGRMSGVNITQNSGVPGGGFTIQIRGQNSVRLAGNAPFYIVDGVPFSSSNSLGVNGLGANNSYNPLNSINLSDIESIDVLKDADATAIYGSRGANGVVLITTKKGQAGKTKVDLNINSGIGRIASKIDLLNTQQYLEMRNEAFKNDGATPQVWNYDLMQWDTTRYTDWQKMLIGGTAHLTNAQVSISGGNTNTQFLIGGGYRRETAVFPGDFANQKASVHFNITNTSTNQKFKTLLTGSYVSDNNKLPSIDLTATAIRLAPNAPAIYDSLGNLNWENSTWSNPFGALQQKYKGKVSNLVGNAALSYQLLRGLQIKASMGYNQLQINEVRTVPLTSYDPAYWYFYQRSSIFADNSITTWIIEPQAEYQTMLGKGKISALIGTTFQQNESKAKSFNASGFNSDALLENIQSAPNVTVASSDYIQYRYNAFFGRLNYSLQDKYIFNLTARRDGSSRFGPGKQFSNFGAVGAAWILSNENFIQKGLPFLSYGKLRGSYGITGNDQIPDYGYLDLWSSTARPYAGVQGLVPDNLLSPDFAWERNNKLEAGLELGFARDRILFSASYYRNRSDNQLVGALLPLITGFASIQANSPAKVQNTSLELELNTVNVRKKDVTWNTSFNITIARNKLIAYPDLALSAYAYQYAVGEPLSIWKRYHSLGVNSQTGVYQFEGGNGEPTSSPAFPTDLRSIKNVAPDFYGGLSNSVQYKGLQLDIHFQFVKQLGRNYLAGSFQAPGMALNQPVIVLNRWQKPGDNASVQKFTQSYSAAYLAYSRMGSADNGFSDASFIRLKNVSLSYQLPGKWKEKLRMQNCRIYVQGQNLFTITNYSGFDPENQSLAILPPLRMITTGIQFTF